MVSEAGRVSVCSRFFDRTASYPVLLLKNEGILELCN